MRVTRKKAHAPPRAPNSHSTHCQDSCDELGALGTLWLTATRTPTTCIISLFSLKPINDSHKHFTRPQPSFSGFARFDLRHSRQRVGCAKPFSSYRLCSLMLKLYVASQSRHTSSKPAPPATTATAGLA